MIPTAFITHWRTRVPWENDAQIEQDLIKVIPKNEWIIFSHRLIWHGRKVCDSRRPKCEICTLNKLCKSAFKINVQ